MNQNEVVLEPWEIKALKSQVATTTLKPQTQSLPEDFDGTFYFTNFSDEDFVTRWNNIEYVFKALSTSPIHIPTASAYETQEIRKKFAKELARREFYRSKEYKKLNELPRNGVPAMYVEKVLEPLIQQCLNPLPIKKAESKELPKKKVKTHIDEDGNPTTEAVGNTKAMRAALRPEGDAITQIFNN